MRGRVSRDHADGMDCWCDPELDGDGAVWHRFDLTKSAAPLPSDPPADTCPECGHEVDAHRFDDGCAYIYNSEQRERCGCDWKPSVTPADGLDVATRDRLAENGARTRFLAGDERRAYIAGFHDAALALTKENADAVAELREGIAAFRADADVQYWVRAHSSGQWAMRLIDALAPADPTADMDVKRLARAMHNGWEGEPCPDADCPDIDRWLGDARNLIREYAALAAALGGLNDE